MNFNNALFLILITSLLCLSACGVKSPPIPYDEVSIPSYINSYTGEQTLNPTPPPKEKEKRK